MADLVESIAGAVLLDCGLDLELLWKIFVPLLNPLMLVRTVHPVVAITERCSKAGIVCKSVSVREGVPRGVQEEQFLIGSVVLGESAPNLPRLWLRGGRTRVLGGRT